MKKNVTHLKLSAVESAGNRNDSSPLPLAIAESPVREESFETVDPNGVRLVESPVRDGDTFDTADPTGVRRDDDTWRDALIGFAFAPPPSDCC